MQSTVLILESDPVISKYLGDEVRRSYPDAKVQIVQSLGAFLSLMLSTSSREELCDVVIANVILPCTLADEKAESLLPEDFKCYNAGFMAHLCFRMRYRETAWIFLTQREISEEHYTPADPYLRTSHMSLHEITQAPRLAELLEKVGQGIRGSALRRNSRALAAQLFSPKSSWQLVSEDPPTGSQQ
jgi:hypothetical protein